MTRPSPNKTAAQHSPWTAPRLVLLCVIAAPAALAAGVHVSTLANGFVYDDKWTLERLTTPHPREADGAEDTAVREHAELEPTTGDLFGFLRSGRGLTFAIHHLDLWLWGQRPFGFHLTNVILHALAAAAAAAAALSLTRSPWTAALCGLLFAVHPVHVEAVALFAYRKDLLAMIFVAGAVVSWRSLRYPLMGWCAAGACVILALFSKETSAIGVVPMLFLADLLLPPDPSAAWPARLRRAMLRCAPLFALGGVAVLWFAGDLAQFFTPPYLNRVLRGGVDHYAVVLATTLGVVPQVGVLMLWPNGLSADHPVVICHGLSEPAAILGAVLLLGWMFIAAGWSASRPTATFAMAWAVILYLPYSNIIPLGGFPVAERYLYVPSFGICLLAAVACSAIMAALLKRDIMRRVVVVGVVVLLLAASVRSAGRCLDWRNDLTLWSSAIRDGFDTVRANHNLGNARAANDDLAGALQAWQRVLVLDPLHVNAASYLGIGLHHLGRDAEAISAYRDLVQRTPHNWRAHEHLGNALAQSGRRPEALAPYERAIALLRALPSDEHADTLANLEYKLRAARTAGQ